MNNQFKISEIADLIIRLFLIGLLLVWCFVLIRPFIGIMLWGIILAIAIFPLFLWCKNCLGGRGKLTGTIITLVGVAVIIGPMSFMATIFVNNVDTLAQSIQSGNLVVPPPPEGIEDLPFIGGYVNRIWEAASVNLINVLSQFRPLIEQLTKNLLFLAANIGFTLLKFIFSIIIAGILIINAEGLSRRLRQVFVRLTPQQGQGFLQLATATIRGVTRGIIGVAVLQNLLIALGLMVAGIPFAGLLSLLSLVLTIIQIGPGLVVFPAIIYAWSTMGNEKIL
ncbi:MAG: AI-2E family transporter [Crocosphaera sp.]|nr:AI-2E family transporter [Crocosphaera sp.]